MKEKKQIRVGISAGDLNGIGPEITLKTLEEGLIFEKNIIPIVYHHVKAFQFIKKALQINDFRFQNIQNIQQIKPKMVNYFEVDPQPLKVEFGRAQKEIAQFAFRSFELAARDLMEQNIDVLVTAPLTKTQEQEGFVGHTGYLADLCGVKNPLMMMVYEKLRIAVLSDHLPLEKVSEQLTAEKLKSKINTFYQSLQEDFGIEKPKIAVLGLNPHAGEGGLLGTEEGKIISPVIQEMIEKENKFIFGPFSADGFFGFGDFAHFDGILAMYHDQGLIPFKLLAQGKGVNFTAGLPFIRTSPAHGTAYGIAGKGIADHSSMREAIELGAEIFQRRKEFLELKENHLGHFQKEKERN